MGARYSDRFFGPEGAAGEPRTPPSEQLDLVEGVDIGAAAPTLLEHGEPARERRSWHTYLAARAALVCAVLVGAGGGAYGWDRWRDHEIDVVARSTVDITSTASLDSMSPDVNQVTLTLHLKNDGQYPLTVTGVAPLDARLSRAGDPWRPLDLDGGEDALRILNFAVDCAEEAAPGGSDNDAAVLEAQLRTVDGRQHRQQLGVVGVGFYGGSLGQLITDQCSFQNERASFGSLYAEIGDVQQDGDAAVTSTVLLNDPYSGTPAQSAAAVDTAPSGSAFTTALVHTEPVAPDLVAPLIVRWTVGDCTAALAATDSDMTVALTGSMPSEAALSTLYAYPTPALAAALARLSERVCG